MLCDKVVSVSVCEMVCDKVVFVCVSVCEVMVCERWYVSVKVLYVKLWYCM